MITRTIFITAWLTMLLEANVICMVSSLCRQKYWLALLGLVAVCVVLFALYKVYRRAIAEENGMHATIYASLMMHGIKNKESKKE